MSRVIRITLAIALIAGVAFATACGGDSTKQSKTGTPSAVPSVGANLTETQQLELGMARTMITEFFASISEGDFKTA